MLRLSPITTSDLLTTSRRALHVGVALWRRPPGPDTPYRPRRTEPARRIRALVEAAADQGDPQTVLTTAPRRLAVDGDTGNVRVLMLPSRHLADVPVARTMSAVASLAGSVDDVHLHLFDTVTPAALYAVIALTGRGRGLVVHLHGSRGMPLRTGATGSWRARLWDSLIEEQLLRAADLVVVPSVSLAEVATRGGARVVTVIPPASLPVVAPGPVRPSTAPATARWIVSVGPLTPRRRTEALVRALTLQPPDTHLLLLGSGPCRAEVERTADRRRLSSRVHVVTDLTWRTVTDHVAFADVVATAALTGEDPTATLLAMAAGRPTVCTTVESLPAVVSDGVDGLLVPPGDDEALAGALRTTLTDNAQAAALGASALRRDRATGWASRASHLRAALEASADIRT